MATTLPAFIDYFRQLAGQHLGIKTFVHGAAGRIISGARSELEYPVLWLETPSLAFQDKDGTAPFGQRHAAFVVLASASPTDFIDQDEKWTLTEGMALDVLSRLRRDHKARKFIFDLNAGVLEAVATLTVANEIGWRYEFTLGDYVPLTYDASRWAEEGTVAP